jgi:crossover junction endodeoxyribonuclease RuvC
VTEDRNVPWERTVLGIDPGSQNAGYAIIETKEKSFKIIDSGVCKMNPKIGYFKRLSMLSDFFLELTENVQKFDLAIESLAYVKNVNSFGKLAQARGAILAVLEPRAERIHEYPPNLIKSTVSGYGHASKQHIEKSLGFSIKNKDFRTHDESDAIAVALCHHFQRGQITKCITKQKGSRSLKAAFKGRDL